MPLKIEDASIRESNKTRSYELTNPLLSQKGIFDIQSTVSSATENPKPHALESEKHTELSFCENIVTKFIACLSTCLYDCYCVVAGLFGIEVSLASSEEKSSTAFSQDVLIEKADEMLKRICSTWDTNFFMKTNPQKAIVFFTYNNEAKAFYADLNNSSLESFELQAQKNLNEFLSEKSIKRQKGDTLDIELVLVQTNDNKKFNYFHMNRIIVLGETKDGFGSGNSGSYSSAALTSLFMKRFPVKEQEKIAILKFLFPLQQKA